LGQKETTQLRTSAILVSVWSALASSDAFCQTSLQNDPLMSRSLVIADGIPVSEQTARDYQRFFSGIKDLGKFPLSDEASRSVDFSQQELHSLIAITADLADESLVMHRAWRSLKFESLMEGIESGSASPPIQEKMRALQDQWAQTIFSHAQRLRAALGEQRFRAVDEFIHSGRAMFAIPRKQAK